MDCDGVVTPADDEYRSGSSFRAEQQAGWRSSESGLQQAHFLRGPRLLARKPENPHPVLRRRFIGIVFGWLFI